MKWLHRDLITGPYLALCTSEADFHRAMKHCKVPREQWATWITDGADATTHQLTNPDGGRLCVVCIRAGEQHSGVQIAAMLVHEAVHVWQFHCQNIGEREPSSEFEAYSIQAISQRLMQAYADAQH